MTELSKSNNWNKVLCLSTMLLLFNCWLLPVSMSPNLSSSKITFYKSIPKFIEICLQIWLTNSSVNESWVNGYQDPHGPRDQSSFVDHLTHDPLTHCQLWLHVHVFIWSRAKLGRLPKSQTSTTVDSGWQKRNREQSRVPKYFLNGWILPAVERFQTHENDTGKCPLHRSEL